MILRLKNWRLATLAFIFIILFTSLGFWQLSRAKYKKLLLKSYTERTLQAPLLATDLAQKTDYRFYRTTLKGEFDNRHVFLLDNKIFHGKIGYEVFIPFKAQGFELPILVDLGFVEIGRDRNHLPIIQSISKPISITGMFNLPPRYVSFGPMMDSKTQWPQRIEFVNLNKLSQLLNYPLFPYLLLLEPKNPYAFPIEWQITVMSPEKHMAYAVQWFALALTLLLLFVILNYRKGN